MYCDTHTHTHTHTYVRTVDRIVNSLLHVTWRAHWFTVLHAGPALEKKYFGAWRASKGLAKAAAEKKKEEEAEPPKEEKDNGKVGGLEKMVDYSF